MKRINLGSRSARLLLALVPIAGCGVIAWMGANRPERLIVGKWRIDKKHTIEFESDGYYTRTERRDEWPLVHRGRFNFPGKNRLRLQIHSLELGGREEVRSAGTTPREIDIYISGDNAVVRTSELSSIIEEKWTRIE